MKTPYKIGLSVAGGLVALGVGASSLTEKTRNDITEALETARKELTIDPASSSEIRKITLGIRTNVILLGDMVKRNKEFHGFWDIGGKIGNTDWSTPLRIEGDMAKIASVNPDDLTEVSKDLKQITQEFGEKMQGDEDEIYETLREGVYHLSRDDIQGVQEYISECLKIIDEELTSGDEKIDFLMAGDEKLMLSLRALAETDDTDEASSIIYSLIQHYEQLHKQNGSNLALHHIAEIAARLKSGDSTIEILGKWGIGISALAIGMSFLYVLIKIKGMIIAVRVGITALRRNQEILHSIIAITATIGHEMGDKLTKIFGKIINKIRGNNGQVPPPIHDTDDETIDGNFELVDDRSDSDRPPVL